MPIYEYRCLDCSESFETLVLKKDEMVQCPKCKGNNVERLCPLLHLKAGIILLHLLALLLVQPEQAQIVAVATN